MKVNKREMIERIAKQNPLLSERMIYKIIDDLFIEISQVVKSGGVATFRPYGKFQGRITKPRISRNPKTGEKHDTPSKIKPWFKAGNAMRAE